MQRKIRKCHEDESVVCEQLADLKTLTPLIAIILSGLFGGTAIINFIISAFFTPSVNTYIYVEPGDKHKAIVTMVNEGKAPAKNLLLTIHSPANISNYKIFSTENYSKLNYPSALQVFVPRFVHGEGSLINVDLMVDPKANISSSEYTVYSTHDQGSVRKVTGDTKPEDAPEALSNLSSNTTLILASVSIVIGVLGYLINRQFHKIKNEEDYTLYRMEQLQKFTEKRLDMVEHTVDNIQKDLSETKKNNNHGRHEGN